MRRTQIFVGAAILFPLFVALLLRWPLAYSIEFDARGEFGDEEIRVTKNWNSITLLDEVRLGKEWKKYHLESFGYINDVRIYCLNLNSTDPARQITIRNGVVKLYVKNMMGSIVDRMDMLNIHSRYLGLDQSPLFKDDSMAMATVRGGITGWTGYYEMYPGR